MNTDKDRAQKSDALQFSVANRWFPQLEIDVHSTTSIETKKRPVTDIDVIASAPDYFTGFRNIIFDCKTKARESPINRSLWLAGLMQKTGASNGFCILKKRKIGLDYRLYAEELNVTLLTENDFTVYKEAMLEKYMHHTSNTGCIDLWEEYFQKVKNSQNLVSSLIFLRSDYWMIQDAASSCRRVITELCSIRAEMNPDNKYHVCLFFHFSSLLARSLAIITTQIFKSYLQPENKTDLANALLHLLYGGKESYDHRNLLFKKAKQQIGHDPVDLSLPNWNKFVDLVRQTLDKPRAIQNTPLSLIESGLGYLTENPDWNFLSTLSNEDNHATSFAIMINSYLAKAAKLPPEFESISDSMLLPIQSTY